MLWLKGVKLSKISAASSSVHLCTQAMQVFLMASKMLLLTVVQIVLIGVIISQVYPIIIQAIQQHDSADASYQSESYSLYIAMWLLPVVWSSALLYI